MQAGGAVMRPLFVFKLKFASIAPGAISYTGLSYACKYGEFLGK